eukprot:5898944-Pleurochrysis_carterae.AAC.3
MRARVTSAPSLNKVADPLNAHSCKQVGGAAVPEIVQSQLQVVLNLEREHRSTWCVFRDRRSRHKERIGRSVRREFRERYYRNGLKVDDRTVSKSTVCPFSTHTQTQQKPHKKAQRKRHVSFRETRQRGLS